MKKGAFWVLTGDKSQRCKCLVVLLVRIFFVDWGIGCTYFTRGETAQIENIDN